MIFLRFFYKAGMGSACIVHSGAWCAALVYREPDSMTRANTPSWEGREGAERLQLASPFLQLEYDLGSGRASLLTAPSQPLVWSATAGVALGPGRVLASDPQYTRQGRITAAPDAALHGPQLLVQCRDAHQHLDLELRFTLLPDRPGAVF